MLLNAFKKRQSSITHAMLCILRVVLKDYKIITGPSRHWDVEQVEVEQGGKLSKWEVEQDGS